MSESQPIPTRSWTTWSKATHSLLGGWIHCCCQVSQIVGCTGWNSLGNPSMYRLQCYWPKRKEVYLLANLGLTANYLVRLQGILQRLYWASSGSRLFSIPTAFNRECCRDNLQQAEVYHRWSPLCCELCYSQGKSTYTVQFTWTTHSWSIQGCPSVCPWTSIN